MDEVTTRLLQKPTDMEKPKSTFPPFLWESKLPASGIHLAEACVRSDKAIIFGIENAGCSSRLD